jgi:4-hydroxybenzoate polyprenyltransferase
VYETILKTVLQSYILEFIPDQVPIILIIVATAFITAGAAVLNDYFDVKIDRINRPERVIVASTVERANALVFYGILTAIGVVAGVISGIISQNYTTILVFIVVPGILWFYSSTYKRQFIIGNIMLALTAALAVLIMAIGFVTTIIKTNPELIYNIFIVNQCYKITLILALFVFLCTWIAAIYKDFINEAGDREMECRTMVIKLGAKKSKIVLLVLIFFVSLTALIFGLDFGNVNSLIFKYIALMINLPLLALMYLTIKAKTVNNYSQTLFLVKIIIVTGILFGLFYTFTMAKEHGFPIFGLFLLK